MSLFCFLLSLLLLVSVNAGTGSPTNVYMVAHSHCDYGWLRTGSEYYLYEVEHILDSYALQNIRHLKSVLKSAFTVLMCYQACTRLVCLLCD